VNARQKRTLRAVFGTPTPANILWSDIESLFRALGATIEERKGSRVAVELHGEDAHFHRSHPQKETDKGAVKAVRDFLEQAGVRP
jgi:hypothetical protein